MSSRTFHWRLAVTSTLALGVMLGITAPMHGAQPKRRNVIFVLSDDHRYDFMSCMPQCPKFLQTPNMDRMAREGAHLVNAFVSTSLCSPSRASILTGQYMHHHRVVDNQRAVPEGTVFFPQYLQQAGYQTALVGKWHMGHDNDQPRPGFDHWVSFQGQGTYFNPTLNINRQHQTFMGYTADVLTDQALKWLKDRRDRSKPFFLYLSYKAVHYPFQPAQRHRGKYDGQPIDYPETMANTARNYQTQPRWVRDRRYSIHGIDHMETGPFDKDPVPDFDDLYHRYCEAVHGLDENLGRVLNFVDQNHLAEDTLVIYMGDNGFALGEHGFYDKRDAFEQSIRVPMLAYAPSLIPEGTKVDRWFRTSTSLPPCWRPVVSKSPKRPRWTGNRCSSYCRASRFRGATIFCTNTIGNGISQPLPPPLPFATPATSTSSITGIGIITDCTISRRTPMNATT